MDRQHGFTLLELLIALALFALLGLGCWQLFDTVVRAQRIAAEQAQGLRSLQRSLAVVERDVLHLLPRSLRLTPGGLQLLRGNWRNPPGQPRSEYQQVRHDLVSSVWRREGQGAAHHQRLLDGVQQLQWRVRDQEGDWHLRWPNGTRRAVALELSLSTARYPHVRRVWLLSDGR